MSTQVGSATLSGGGYTPPAAGRTSSASDVAQSRPVPTPVQEAPSTARLQQAVAEVQSRVESSINSNLQFSLDTETGKPIVRVTDKNTGELIRQLPSEEVLALAKSLDKMQGLLFKQTA